MTLPGAEGLVRVRARGVHEGQDRAHVRAESGYSPLRNDVSTALVVLMCMVGARAAASPARTSRICSSPADSCGRRKSRSGCRSARRAAGSCGSCSTESLVLAGLGRGRRTGPRLSAHAGPARARVVIRRDAAAAVRRGRTRVSSRSPCVLSGLDRGRVRPAARARRQPAGSVAHAQGSDDLDRRLAADRSSCAKGLVAAQVALSFLLLFGAGLFVRSLQNLKTTDTGMAIENLVSFQVVADAQRLRRRPRGTRSISGLLDRLRADPSVESVATARVRAARRVASGTARPRVEGHTPQDGEDMQAFMNAVSPGYFKTMKIPLLEGRDFIAADATRADEGRDRQPEVREALLSEGVGDRQAIGSGHAPGHQAHGRDHRRRRRLALRRAARGRASTGVLAGRRAGQRRLLRAHAHRVRGDVRSDPPQRRRSSTRRCRSTASRRSSRSSTRRC